MGDAFGAGVVEHLSRDDLMSMDFTQREDAVPLEPYERYTPCLLYTSPSPRDQRGSRMPSSA